MIPDWHRDAFWGALKMVGRSMPKNLVSRAQAEAEERGATLDSTHFRAVLKAVESNDPFLNDLGMHVHAWDAAPASAAWTESTEPSTQPRRDIICSRLGIDSSGAAVLLERRPIFVDYTIVITAPWKRWYSSKRAAEHEFYWPIYRRYLLEQKRWPQKHVTSLDIATTQVIERLSDPTRAEAHQSKGLVVGYVQSGKTANFTGVIAKAIDAGYRLVIVMTGTIEMLRAQTQRRIDMEMVGRQNILGDFSPEQAVDAKVDYQDDEAWLQGKFVDLGAEELATEIQRLTTHRKDYTKQFKTLKIERFDMSRRLYEPENLFRTAARLVVVKKNSTVLKKLVFDIKANKNAFAEIPVLIIDDESDQASVNTVDPERIRAAKREGREIVERRAINERIADMLRLMPRAQYVGYTATPFANVFVDPSDPQDIFPKDFVIGLQRPEEYMGVDDFHDLEESSDSQKTYESSNEVAFVRSLVASEDDALTQEYELARAIDMFVLTGAVKLYRENVAPDLTFRHHTMLVHQSVRTAHHRDMAAAVKRIWDSSAYTTPEGKNRLRDLYNSDLIPVSTARLEPSVPPLPSFMDLIPFISKTIARISEHGQNPVIVVNSDREVQQQSLDFDRHRMWRILVGGAKLSRGFTVEGLTVTYFRRATNMSDSLTQMGRWFGFRQGYRDLVRLYIARNATFGRRPVDIYEAFENVALDEAAFRQQLEQYAQWENDKPKVLPSQIPPLVSQHLPWLLPTARNKMFNAVLEEQSEQPFTPAGYANHPDSLKSNLTLWRPILGSAQELISLPQGGHGGSFNAFVGTVPAEEFVDAIEKTKYLYLYAERSVKPKIAFYRRLMQEGLLKDFLIVLPQPDTPNKVIAGVGPRAIISRDRRKGRGGKFGEMTEPKHRPSIHAFIDDNPPSVLAEYRQTTRGAALLYIASETEPNYEMDPPLGLKKTDPEYGLVVAFSAYVPAKALARDPAVIKFRVRNPDEEDRPTVDVR